MLLGSRIEDGWGQRSIIETVFGSDGPDYRRAWLVIGETPYGGPPAPPLQAKYPQSAGAKDAEALPAPRDQTRSPWAGFMTSWWKTGLVVTGIFTTVLLVIAASRSARY